MRAINMETRSRKVFGESVEETLREASEKGVVARARKVEAAPNKKQVEHRNLDHAVFMMWCPHCVKGSCAGACAVSRMRRRRRGCRS